MHANGRVVMPSRKQRVDSIIRNKETIFRQLGEAVDMVFWLRDSDSGELLYISPNYDKLSGRSADWLMHNPRAWYDIIHPDDRATAIAFDHSRETGPSRIEFRFQHADGDIRWVSDQSSPIRDDDGNAYCVAGITIDITEQKRRDAQIHFLNQTYAALSQTNHALITCRDEATLFDRVCRIAVEFGGMAMAWIGTLDAAKQHIVPVARSGRGTDYLDGIVISASVSVPEGRGPTGTAFRESRAVFVQDFIAADSTAPWHERANRYGWRASAAIGIKRAGQPYAVLTLYHAQPHAFDDKTIDLLLEMAANLGHGLDQLDTEAARKKYEQQLAATLQRYHDILETSIDGFWLCDTRGKLLYANSAYSRRSGYSRDELANLRIHDLDVLENAQVIADKIDIICKNGSAQFETMHRAKDGGMWPVEVKTGYLADDNLLFVFLRDLSERKRAEEEIINLGFYDPLTNLPNRRLLHDRLRHALAASARSGLYGAVLFIDLDHFKVINDTVGHETGDLLLQEVATRLRQLVREEDTIARLGGDEFVAILEELDSDAKCAMGRATTVAEKLLQAFAEPYFLDGDDYNCTASIGIVMFHGHEIASEDILKHSDLAMYGAKKSGRNMLRFFDPAMQHELERRTRLEADLRRSLHERQFELYCQKQVDHHGRVCGGEMLLRWNHPERGLVSPLEFIPLAEESGLIVPIGQWVLREACRLLAEWTHDPATRHIRLSVNVSARELRQSDFVDNLRQILHDTGARPMRLEIEITESMLLDNIDEFIAKMLQMKELGVTFSLDDFGTGYSSLSYLKKLPLNQLKIDRSFVQDLGKDMSDEAIVQTIIRMSETLGLNVIAEGVETDAQRDMLHAFGCYNYQGYLFGKPVPISHFVQSLR